MARDAKHPNDDAMRRTDAARPRGPAAAETPARRAPDRDRDRGAMPIAVLEKAFRVLEALQGVGAPMPLGQISDEAGLPKATTHRILKTLMVLGYLSQESRSGHYRIAMKLARLGHAQRQDALEARATAYMQELRDAFDETVNLGVLEGDRVCYLHTLETSKALRWIVRPGSTDAFHSTALGRAIVAYLPDEELDALLVDRPLEPRTDVTPTRPDAVRALLREVRRIGWAVDDEENDIGVLCIAVPLLDDGAPVASISVSIPKGRVTPDLRKRIAAALVDVGRRWATTRRGEPRPMKEDDRP